MRARALLVLSLALGAGVAVGLPATCPSLTLDAPAAEAAALARAGAPDVALVGVPGVDPAAATDTHACIGEVRPGARMVAPSGCTMSWVFQDAQGRLYQTTAGHCVPALGQTVSVQGIGDIGRVVFTTGDAGFGNDIALVRIDQGVDVNATLCHWGGPLGVATPADADLPAVGNAMLHYGWGSAFSVTGATRARLGDLTSVPGVSGWFADGSVRMLGATDGGDSGSPMMLENGLAAGVHTHRINPAGTFVGPKVASRLDVWVPRMEEALGRDLALVPGGPVDLAALGLG